MSATIFLLDGDDESEPDDIDLFGMIKAGNIAKMQKLIASGANINQVDTVSGWTPLQLAVKEGNLDITTILLAAGAAVEQGELPPLELAAGSGYITIVNLLLATDKYADKKKTKKFYQALMMAVCGSYVDVVQALIAAGADVNQVVWSGGTALHYATYHGHKPVVKLLLSARANVNIQASEAGMTPLMDAAAAGHAEIANLLIEAGADLNAKNHRGKTALILAAEFGNADIAAIFLRSGADINTRDNDGNSALVYASRDEPGELKQPLLDLVALQKTPIQAEDILEDFGQRDVLSQLITKNQKVGRISIAKMLRTAEASEAGLSGIDLVRAAEEGNLRKVQALIQAGVNLNAKDTYGQTAVFRAAGRNYLDVIATLLAAGADINLGDSEGSTPLITAAYAGHWASVQMLIQAGANLNYNLEWGDTALSYAQYAGHFKIVELLRQSGAKQYHPIPIAQKRGIDSVDLNDSFVLVQAAIEQVSLALCNQRQATIWEKDVFEREVKLTDVCFIVFRFPGHNWTLIHEQNITVTWSYPENIFPQLQNCLQADDAKAISQQLQTKAIYFDCSDTAGAIEYQLFESGKSLEKFTYCCDSDFSNETPAVANECLIVGEMFIFRSKLRQLTVDDLPQHQLDDQDEVSIDQFKFVDDFFKSQNAYVPAWGSSGLNNSAGSRVSLRVIGLDPEDIERMDFVAVE